MNKPHNGWTNRHIKRLWKSLALQLQRQRYLLIAGRSAPACRQTAGAQRRLMANASDDRIRSPPPHWGDIAADVGARCRGRWRWGSSPTGFTSHRCGRFCLERTGLYAITLTSLDYF